MSSDEMDSSLEKDQFEQLYQQKLGKKMETKNSDNYEHSLQQLVNEIIHHPKDPKEKVKHTALKGNKRPKWDTKSTKLFFKLYDFYSGDMRNIPSINLNKNKSIGNIIKNSRKTLNQLNVLPNNKCITKLTKKQNNLMNKNPISKNKQVNSQNIRFDLCYITQRQQTILGFYRQNSNPWSLQGFQQNYKLIKQKQQLIHQMESLHSSCYKSEQHKWSSPKESNKNFKKNANIYQEMEIKDNNNIAFVQIQPDGPSYILTNLSKQYLCQYNKILKEYISETEFRDFILEINAILLKNWPSKYIIYLAYILILFTAGFSLLIPMCCINQAEKYVQWKIDEINIKWESRYLHVGFRNGKLTLFLKSRFNSNSLDEVYEDEIIE